MGDVTVMAVIPHKRVSTPHTHKQIQSKAKQNKSKSKAKAKRFNKQKKQSTLHIEGANPFVC
jgi:hypothetical protein